MEFGEGDSRNLAKSLLSLHRKESAFVLRFATLKQAESVGAELVALGCRVEVDQAENSLDIVRPQRTQA